MIYDGQKCCKVFGRLFMYIYFVENHNLLTLFQLPLLGCKPELIIFWINCLHFLKRNRQLKDKVRNVRTFLKRRDFSTKWYTIFDAIYGLGKTILRV